jgi:flavin reductase (DIM6/NTAB) family NADH-FMN oxidoreductase RutF
MCRTVANPDFGGDHGVFVGEVVRVELNGDLFDNDGTLIGDLRPLMQVTGNVFATASQTFTLPFGTDRAGTV